MTGESGFIGRHPVHRLILEGHAVIALHWLSARANVNPQADFEVFAGQVAARDVRHDSFWKQLGKVRGVLNFAATAGIGQPTYLMERPQTVKVWGAYRAAEIAVVNKAPVVCLTSRCLYREYRAELPEKGTVSGRRRTGESYVGAVNIQPQDVIGHRQILHNPCMGVWAAFLARLCERHPIAIHGEMKKTRAFVYEDDVARAIAWALENIARTGEHVVVFAGSAQPTTLPNLVRFLRAASSRAEGAPAHVDGKRTGDIWNACANLDRLISLGDPPQKSQPSRCDGRLHQGFVVT